jgi:hypothetical protein
LIESIITVDSEEPVVEVYGTEVNSTENEESVNSGSEMEHNILFSSSSI